MSDPLTKPAARTPADEDLLKTMPLFAPTIEQRKSTSRIALDKAAPRFGERYTHILNVLEQFGPMPIFRVAEHLKVPEHTISGRFSELVKQALIEKTGERAEKPSTKGTCDIYRFKQRPAV